MEAIASIGKFLEHWSNGGQKECRDSLFSHHCNLANPDSSDVLASSYEMLIHALLKTWNPSGPKLTSAELVAFIQNTLENLPSTSSALDGRSTNIALFGELLVNLIWAVDAQLTEVIADAKLSAPPARSTAKVLTKDNVEGEDKKQDLTPEQTRAERLKVLAEGDRTTLADLTKKLLSKNLVERDVCKDRLDTPLLTSIGLLRNREAFDKKEVRVRTAEFYKQNKFNLFREQSEGYTKLTVDLLGSLGTPHSSITALPAESSDSVRARAASAWERVVGLIGYFELDPNRAMDIILDIFSANIATHWQFFLAFLSCTPWMGDCTNLSEWESSAAMGIDVESLTYEGKSFHEILVIAEKRTKKGPAATLKKGVTGKLKALAQALGFKFRYYQEKQEECPRSLYLMTALLIREDFILLEDIYPHLGPSDEAMPQHYQDYLTDVQNRIKSSANNLLAMAAPLESQTSNKPKAQATEAKPSVDVKSPIPQKAMIASALLAIGALRPAIGILTRYPWLVDVHKEIADLLLRILSISISPFYDEIAGKQQSTDFRKSRARYGSAGILTTPSRKSQLTLIAPPPHSTHTHDFTFFYPLWADWVPICRSFSDIMSVAAPLMDYIHVYMSRDPLLLTKLLRIGKLHVSQTLPSEGNAGKEDRKQTASLILEPLDTVQEFWLQITRRHILPAISMMSGNAVCTVEVWNIIKQYDNTIRWRLYGEWRDTTYKSHPELDKHRTLREREAKGILRRLSSQTVDSLAGTIAKMAHTNPCIFFTNAVHQIQSYDNLADVVIQALRFSTNMGFDILVFITLDALANPDKDRVKDDGANTSDWLQSLATFTGALFRRYSTDLSPVLRYIVHQLYAGQTSEIIVLERLILKMAGIEPLPSLSNTQVEAMAGGPVLRIEAIASRLRGANLDVSEVLWKGPQRLGKTLVESNLAFPILVQVAQQRQACIFKARDAHPKSLAFLFDATHSVLMQYLELLTSHIAVALNDYKSFIPSLSDLVVEFGIKPAIAMQILRPMLNSAVADYLPKAKERYLKKELSTREQSTQSSEATEKGTQNHSQDELDSQETLVKMETDVNQEPKLDVKAQDIEKVDYESPWVPELEAHFNDCRKILPNNVHDTIGPAFYMTFWQMTLSDIHYPQDRYTETVKALTSARDGLDVKSRHLSGSTEKQRKYTRDRYNVIIEDLKKEMNAQGVLYRYTAENGGRLDREKIHWFSHIGTGKGASFIQSLIEHCIQPRCLLSPMDAVYCSKLIRVLHARGTPGFHTLMCYDKLLGDPVKVVIFSCSENEARNYGRFLKGILLDLYSWHKDQKAYDTSNRRVEGETVTLLPGLQTKWSKDGPNSPDELMKWTEFKSFLKKCHRKLGKSLTDCLHAGEFMHVYNAIIVLKEIIEVFPIAAVNEVVGSTIDLEVQRLVQTEERGDLKILARAYSSSLKKREKLWALPRAAQSTKLAPVKPNTASDSVKSNTSETAATTPNSSHATSTSQQQSQAATAVERPASRLGLESVPRPEVVKRNRTEGKATDVANAEKGRATPDNAMQIDQRIDTGLQESKSRQLSAEQPDSSLNGVHRPIPRSSNALGADLRKEVLQSANGHSRASTPLLQPSVPSVARDSPLSSPAQRSQDLMAPPTAPSQTLQAQELRSSRSTGQTDKSISSPRERQRDVVDSPSRRSPSPGTRPGTRNTSAESRASSGGKRERNRRGRVSPDSDDRRRLIEGPSRAERGGGGYRDAPQGRSERSTRERIPGSSTRDADREREVDQDRKRDRDRDKKDRESRREHRERDRDKADRDKERDRHRRDRDDKDRERKPSAPKEAESTTEHGGSTRSDNNRHRTHSDESLGKRRRAPDDEPERSAKRGSRRDGHREERLRRQELGRDSVRDGDHTRRKERDPSEADANVKLAPIDKPSERPRRGETPPPQSPRVSAPVPSGPRAMAPSPRAGPRSDTLPPVPFGRDREPERSERRNERLDRTDRYERTERLDRNDRVERDRGERPERESREWRTNAEGPSTPHEAPARGGPNGSLPPLAPASNSLRERIDGGPNSFTGNSHHRGSLSNREDYGDGRKRTMSERDREAVVDVPLSGGSNSSSATTSAPKRQRVVQINRNRYQGDSNPGALARKALNNLPK